MGYISDRKKAVLIIDDEPDNCFTIDKFLADDNIDVSTFTNPLSALEHFRNMPEKYDIVLCDVKMPRMSSFELCKRLKEIDSGVTIVMMPSNDLDKNDLLELMANTNIEGFIMKPIPRENLRNLIDSI